MLHKEFYIQETCGNYFSAWLAPRLHHLEYIESIIIDFEKNTIYLKSSLQNLQQFRCNY